MRHSPQTIGKILSGQNGATDTLIAKAKILARMEKILRTHLDASVSHHIQIGNIKNNQLVIFVDSQAWASRLRFEQANILQILKAHPDYAFLQSIVVRVYPLAGKNETRYLPRPSMSRNAANAIESLSGDITDTALASALKKLAKNAR